MLDFPRWKQILLWFVTAACAFATLPTVFAATGLAWPSVLPAPMINLGLDLAGGSHLLLEADSNQIRQLRLGFPQTDSAASIGFSLKPLSTLRC